MTTTKIVIKILKDIRSFKNMLLRIEEKIGIEAKINTTFAALVYSTAMTNAADVDPKRKQYNHPSFPIMKTFLKLFLPFKTKSPKAITQPAVRLFQNAVIIGSEAISLTNRE